MLPNYSSGPPGTVISGGPKTINAMTVATRTRAITARKM